MSLRRCLPLCLTATCFSILSIGVPAPAARFGGSSAAPPAPLDGRWEVTLEGRGLRFETTFQFDTRSDGALEAAAVGPLGGFNVVFTGGRFDPAQNRVSLDAKTLYGPAHFTGTVRGDTLEGRWDLTAKRLLFVRLGTGGTLHGVRSRAARKTPPADPLRVFDAVWETVDRRFYDPRFGGADWQKARSQFRPQAEAARTEAALVNAVRSLLGTLKSSHLDFFAETTVPAALSGSADPSAPSTPDESAPPLTWKKLSTSTGYLRIASFAEAGPDAVARVDAVFAELGSLPSLVIDLRGNPGGTLDVATRLGDHLFPAPRTIGYFVTRKGLAKQDVASIDALDRAKLPAYSGNDEAGFNQLLQGAGGAALVVGGKVKEPYRGRVALLIDEECGSTTEAVAAAAKEAGAATLVGRRTAGAMLGSDVTPVGGGWLLQVPFMDYRTAKGARIEGKGVTPDVRVKKAKVGEPDAVLDAALRALQRREPSDVR